jgi:hypothetical protein
MIYFIQAGDGGPVKIGHTKHDAHKRLKELQTGCPEKLTVVGVIEGDRSQERQLHEILDAYRIHGEWFEVVPATQALGVMREAQAQNANDQPPLLRAKSTRNPDFTWEGPLSLYWEVEGDPITDNYTPREVSARELWRMWKGRYGGEGTARISWFISGPGFLEMAPVGNEELRSVWSEDYYSFFAHPVDAAGRSVPWLSLPVVDKMWNAKRADKGGFIQQATGWKPSAFQTVMDVGVIERVVDMGDDDFRQDAREGRTPEPVECVA